MIKKYTVESHGIIPGLGISGPLTTPTKMEFHDVLKMVKSGMVVYQHNPYNSNEKVRVTIRNINNISFSISDGIKATNKRKEAIQKVKGVKIDTVRKVELYNTPKQNDEKNNNGNKNKDKHQQQFTKPDEFEKN